MTIEIAVIVIAFLLAAVIGALLEWAGLFE